MSHMGVAMEILEERLSARTSSAIEYLEYFVRLFLMPPHERVELIRQGVTAKEVAKLSSTMSISQEVLMSTIGISRATVHRKVQRKEALSPDESERILGIEAIIGHVAHIIDPDALTHGFNPARWVAEWLDKPQPSLAGKKPSSYMDTVEGQKMVSRLLARVEAGVYA